MWQTQWEKPKLALGADPVEAEGQGRQGEVPQHPLDPMAGPLGFQESQRGGVLQRSSPSQQVFGIMRPIPPTARSGRMGGCVMPPHRSMCHRHAHTFPSDRRPLRVPYAPWLPGLRWDHRPPVRECTQRGRANPTRATAEGRQSGGGQDGCRWEGISPGCHRPRKPLHPPPKKRSGPSQGIAEGRKHPFPPHPPRQWEEPPEKTQR